MKGYWISVYTKIENKEKLKEYAAKATLAIKKYSGVFLVRGVKHTSLEGLDYPRTVIVVFPNYDIAEKCYNSTEYKEALRILKGNAERNLQIIEGFNTE